MRAYPGVLGLGFGIVPNTYEHSANNTRAYPGSYSLLPVSLPGQNRVGDPPTGSTLVALSRELGGVETLFRIVPKNTPVRLPKKKKFGFSLTRTCPDLSWEESEGGAAPPPPPALPPVAAFTNDENTLEL